MGERKYNSNPNSTSFKKGHKPLEGAFGKGSKHTEESKEKVSQSLIGRIGNLARNWQGGKTKNHILIRYSSKMKEWRKAVKNYA